jgi:hypothetical protein
MRKLLVAMVAVGALAAAGAAVAASASLRSLEGRWSGTGHTRAGYESGPLPVSFTVKAGKVSKLTLGPAKVACRTRFEGGTPSFFATMPKLQGFPSVRIQPLLREYVALFLGSTPSSYSVSHDVVIPPTTPVAVEVGGFFSGKKFTSVGASTVEVTYAANEHGAFEANGAYSCNGSWSGAVATHH